MKKFLFLILLTSFYFLFLFVPTSQSQVAVDQLHGDQKFSASGLHSGNQIKTSFWNDGQVGYRRSHELEDIKGEWPINSGHIYLAKIATFFGSEVVGTDGRLYHIISESNGTATGEDHPSSGDFDRDTGEWWSMTPLPGFHNLTPPPEESDEPRVAMTQWKWSWPKLWPDKLDDVVDPGWPGSWNGYFGKNILNADQESYYVMDDYNNREFPFYPDSRDSTRRGLGLRVSVRGLQWSNVKVEDCLFLLYDVKNIGTHQHDKMLFGMMVGPDIGSDQVGSDPGDDGGDYDLEEDLAYQFDSNNIGYSGWSPVGILGAAYFESPGNPYDGIDNDGDGKNGTGPVITPDMFQPRAVQVGSDVVVIDYETFERKVVKMPPEGIFISFNGKDTTITAGNLTEIPHNLIDDNLNGLIDENDGSVIGEGPNAIHRYLYEGLKYVDYFTGEGLDNILLDERRDDGIDNDGDWNPEFDDVGLDGVDHTYDPGEGDGLPTSGAGTDLPGEPHIDKTDIDESDMIGLTSYNIFNPWDKYPLSADEKLWNAVKPGFLNATGQIGDTQILLASGYFPLKPGDIERFSIGYLMGYPLDDLYRNKKAAEMAYNGNYNFAKAPLLPTLMAVPGDGKVTLYWDDLAEQSLDPISGHDFEGYRIYRSTSPDWGDMAVITDGHASAAYRKPLAQFDLKNGIKGFSKASYQGIKFYLGDDTGLVHSFVDSNVTNGQLYYYAVTAYDNGGDTLGFFPAETSKYISITKDGKIDKGRNVVLARPSEPVAGYQEAKIEKRWNPGRTASGEVVFDLYDKTKLENHEYVLTFDDTTEVRGLFSWKYPNTRSFTFIDITDPMNPDTIIAQDTTFRRIVRVPGDRGFNLMIMNAVSLDLNIDKSGWNRQGLPDFDFKPINVFSPTWVQLKGTPRASDYRIEIGEPAISNSVDTLGFHSIPANFIVINTTKRDTIPFIFEEKDKAGGDGLLTGNDTIYFLESDSTGTLVPTWKVRLEHTSASQENPGPGDVLRLTLNKPFLSNDTLYVKTTRAYADRNRAKNELDNIKVVPNPYVVTNSWEPRNPFATGRGPRELHFIHLPQKCTIRIFNVLGQLVATLEHESTIYDGREIWNMLSKDNLDIAYGVYIYHVEAPGIGEKIGKFAVIK